MPSYGRYFEVLIAPTPEQRRGRYITGAAVLPIGGPVEMTGTVNMEKRDVVQLATGDTAPVPGVNGIAIFEHAYNAYAGQDPTLVNPSDFPDVPVNSPIQLVSGTEVKVRFKNIAADTVFPETGGRTYDDARVMVAGDLSTFVPGTTKLRPGVGDGTSGYWAVAAGGETPWFVVTAVDADNGEVEAQMLF